MLKDILERKWTSVAKLKKEVDELTKVNRQLKDQIASGAGCERCNAGAIGVGGLGSANGVVGDGLPKEPERHLLRGHKSRITHVAMHPVYSDVASSSEDGSIKIWDFEQGEITTTMKGHTGSVNYVSYHPNGQVIASCSTD
jgi:platelet-activating factor acetylhydrolase IB subunit alpha